MLLARSNCIAMARSALVAASAISDWSGAAALLGAPKRVAIAVLPVERRCSTLGPCGVTTFRHGTSHATPHRSEEHTSELQSLMRISYAVFCLKKKTITNPSRAHKLDVRFNTPVANKR